MSVLAEVTHMVIKANVNEWGEGMADRREGKKQTVTG